MNITQMTRAALETALAAKLRELLGGVSWFRGWQVERLRTPPEAGCDVLATLPLPGGGQAALCVLCKRELHPSAFRILADKTCRPPGSRPKAVVRVLGLPFVSSRLAGLCMEHGWSWFDLAGNHLLDVPGLLHLRHTGNEPVHARLRPTANLGTPEAGRVLRALLALENGGRRWTQREMQNHCQPNVSLGLVNKVVRHLLEEAFIEVGSGAGFRLRDPSKLLLAWREVYPFDRHQRRGYFTLLPGKKVRDALATLHLIPRGHAAYAAFSAADFQAPHVRQPRTWLYLSANLEDRFREAVEAKLVDSGENLVVLIPDDDGVFYMGDGGVLDDNRMACTNAVQTYLDLWQCGGRGQEAAEALLEQRFTPEWKARGLL